jgi:hypothetical protein
MAERIGVLVGWEQSFPEAFIDAVQQGARASRPSSRRSAARPSGGPRPYRVLIDRISQEVKHYRFAPEGRGAGRRVRDQRSVLVERRRQVLRLLAGQRAGVAVPRTVMLPQKDYIPAIDKNRSLRNLEFPLDWESIVDYVGFPAILKPADGGGWRDVSVVRTPGRAAARLRRVGHNVMTLQEFIDFDRLHPLHLHRPGPHPADRIQPEADRADGPARALHLPRPGDLAPEGPARPDGARRHHDQQGAPVRHELGGVRDQGRRAVRDRLHEPRARHAHRAPGRAVLQHRGRLDGGVRGEGREGGLPHARPLPLGAAPGQRGEVTATRRGRA